MVRDGGDLTMNAELTPTELKARLSQPEPLVLVDVRQDWETRLCRLEHALHIPIEEIELPPASSIPPRKPLSTAIKACAALPSPNISEAWVSRTCATSRAGSTPGRAPSTPRCAGTSAQSEKTRMTSLTNRLPLKFSASSAGFARVIESSGEVRKGGDAPLRAS